MLELLLVTGWRSSYAFLRPTTGKAVSLMRRTILLFTTMALALLLAAGTAWAALPAPTVVGTRPANGDTNVALDAKIKVKFSEPMKDRSINPNNIKIYLGCTGTLVPATVDYVDEITPVRAVLKPVDPLADDTIQGTTYRVEVEGANALDGNGVKDASGTPMVATYTFFFSTGDTVVTC
jgi:Bacterial Ig-like domain